MNEQIEGNVDTIDDLYMIFIINNQKYALSSKYIIEIVGLSKITTVPFIPKYINGIINLRSTIIPIIDARMRFGINRMEYNERTCIIIIENKDDKVGLIVDSVSEVITILPEQSMKMDSTKASEIDKNFIKSVSEINGETQLILDCDSLIRISEEFKNEINE
ncbi:MAG: chemotaxis protein CheW [Peptostreptococcaceae bacterium]